MVISFLSAGLASIGKGGFGWGAFYQGERFFVASVNACHVNPNFPVRRDLAQYRESLSIINSRSLGFFYV